MCKFGGRFLVAFSTFVLGLAITSFLRLYLNHQPQALSSVAQLSAPLNSVSSTEHTKASEWQKIVRDKFSFELPNGMQPVHGYKEKSGDRSYSNGRGLQIIYWYGGGSCLYPIHPGTPPTSEKVIEIDGVKAKFGVGSFEALETRVPYVCFSPAGSSKSKLSIVAFAHSQEGVEIAERIFSSVRFLR